MRRTRRAVPSAVMLPAMILSAVLMPVAEGPAWSDAPDPAPVRIGAQAQRNEGLTVVEVRSGTLSRVLPALARVMPDDSRVVHIRPAGSGKVLSVAVMAGQHVARNATLLQYLDHSLHVARLQATQMQAALDAAVAARDEAAAAWRRGRDLSGSTVSAGEVRRRLAVLQEAQNTVVARQADVGTMTHRFREEFNSVTERDGTDETSTLLSPVEGTVQTVAASVAGDVSPGQDVMTVVDLSLVWIVSDLPPQDAARVVVGGRQETRIGDRRLLSRIGTVDGMAAPATGLVRVISAVPNPDGDLRPGMMVDTELETDERASGLLVPTEAVQRVAGRDVVFVRTAPDMFRPVPVTLGLESGGSTVVLSGLAAGQSIAAHGSFALKSMLLLSALGGD